MKLRRERRSGEEQFANAVGLLAGLGSAQDNVQGFVPFDFSPRVNDGVIRLL